MAVDSRVAVRPGRMKPLDPPAIAGGTPVRLSPLPYGRHRLEESDIDAVVASLRSGTLTGGADIADFEHALAARCKVEHAVAVTNGSAALDLAVLGLGIGPGDEVITTPLTFVATANAVVRAGATPVFADVGDDRCLDPESVARAVTPRTKAVITVDYSGLPSDVPALKAALPRSLPVIADSAHSLGGSLHGRPVGSLADITTLSFHPVKQMTTGEGGACLTGDGELASRIRALRNHGMTSTADERTGLLWKYDVTMLGDNHRMTAFQAALGRSQLRRLDEVVAERSEIADRYDALLLDIPGIRVPPRLPGRRNAWHIYPIEIDPDAFGCERDVVIDALRAEGIEATLHYPALHLLSFYRARGGVPGAAPRAEALCERLVTLPLYPTMTTSDQDDVVTALRRIHVWAAHTVAE
jgi:perosamine synthetase